MEMLVYVLIVAILAILFIGFLVLSNYSPKVVTNIKELGKVFPINSVESGLIVNGKGEITVGYELNLPDVFTISEEDADKLHTNFISIFRLLPEGTVIHKQDFFFLDRKEKRVAYKTLIEQENREMVHGRPILKNRSAIYVTFCSRINYDKSSLLDLQRSPNYLFKEPSWMKGYEKRMEDIKKIIETFENGLNGIPGIRPKRKNDEELLEDIYRYMNCDYEGEITEEDKKKYLVSPIEIDAKGSMRVGRYFVKVLTLAEEPVQMENHAVPKTAPSSAYGNGVAYSSTIKSKTSFVFPLACGLPIDHVLNTTVQILDNDKVVSKLESENKMLSFLGNFYPPANVKQREVSKFVETILNNNFQICKTGVNVLLRETSFEALEKSISNAEMAFLNMARSKPYIENYDTANMFFSMIPGNAENNYKEFINTTAQAVCYINKEGMVQGDVNGIVFQDRYGNPVVIDLWNNKNTVNRNKVIIGPSGSGKSFNINEIVSQDLGLGNHVMIIDIGHSYKRNVEFNGGKYYNSEDKKSLSFNLFDCKRDGEGKYIYKDTEDEEAADDKVNLIVTVLLTIVMGKKEVEPIERGLFKQSVESYYQYVNSNGVKADLKGYVDYLEVYEQSLTREHKRKFKADDIKLIMRPFVSGDYKHLLNSERSLDIESDKFLVFDLEAVQKDETVFPIMVVIVIELIIQKINKLKGVRKTLIIDEALNFLQDEKMGDFIGYLYRTFRKKEGEVIIAAQNVNFLEAAAEVVKNSIIMNTATKIFLDHSEHTSNYKDIQRILSLTNHQIELLDSLEKGKDYREFLMVLGKETNIYRMQVSKFANAVYTSKESEVQEMEEIKKKTGSMESAIRQYIENKE